MDGRRLRRPTWDDVVVFNSRSVSRSSSSSSLSDEDKENDNGDEAITQDGEDSAKKGKGPDGLGFKKRVARTWISPNGRDRSSAHVTWVSQSRYEKLSRVLPKPPADERDLKLHAVSFDTYSRTREITILSPRLISAYKKVYSLPISSKRKFETGEIEESWPYADLYRHMDDLRREIADQDEEEATQDFKALEFVVQEATGDLWSAEKATPISDKTCYEQLWQIFVPGSLVVCRDNLENDCLLMLVSAEFNTSYLSLFAWQLGWNVLHQVFNRQIFKFNIKKFNDWAKITSLPLYPLDALPELERNELLSKCQVRGKKWAQLVSGPCSCFSYSGLSNFTYTENPLTRVDTEEKEVISSVDERMIIDTSNFDARKTVLPKESFLVMASDAQGNLEDNREEYVSWDKLSPTHEFTNEQAQFCPASIQCTSIASERLHIVCVDKLSPVDWNKQALDRLVLPSHQKSMLRSLVKQQTGGKARKGGDLIRTKGQGLVILLHGPPGVGKTLTAESLSEYVERPLLPLSIGNLVNEEGDAEGRLLAIFRKATRWKAILLLDEADVILEARSFEDIKRNGIVSMLLRNLEYFNGVLFLTTDRFSTMDSAFESRIQIAIEYRRLQDTTRALVWRNLLNSKFDSYEEDLTAESLDETRKEAIKASMEEAKLEILANIDVLASHELNGRQIRNSLNIAEGLAFKDSQETGQMRLRHLTQSVHMALEFQGFFKKARAKAQLDSTSVWAPYEDVDSD